MATTMYFEETVVDQGGKHSVDLELGRSSYYPEDSIYLTVDGKLSLWIEPPRNGLSKP